MLVCNRVSVYTRVARYLLTRQAQLAFAKIGYPLETLPPTAQTVAHCDALVYVPRVYTQHIKMCSAIYNSLVSCVRGLSCVQHVPV